MKYKITRKLVLYFTSVILLFSLVVGGAFLLLFTRHTEQIYRADMQERAEAIAAGVADYLEDGSTALDEVPVIAKGSANGKQTGTRLVAFNDNNDQPWITLTKSQTGDNLSYNLTISVAKNSGEARSGSVVLTQSVSGKTIEIVFNQAAGVTVQDYILLGPLITNFMFLAAGGTETVEVESYILWTDGSKTGALPYIGSKPSWLTVDITAKNQYVGNTKYLVKMTVAPNTGAIRNGSLYLDHPSAGGPTIEFTLSQGEQITDTDITLTLRNLPTNGTVKLPSEVSL